MNRETSQEFFKGNVNYRPRTKYRGGNDLYEESYNSYVIVAVVFLTL